MLSNEARTAGREAIEHASAAVARLADRFDAAAPAVELIVEATGRVVVCGLGKSGLAEAPAGPAAGPGKSPGTRSKAVAMLRAELIKAQEYAKKREAKDETKRPGRDLKIETLLRALDGSQPMLT